MGYKYDNTFIIQNSLLVLVKYIHENQMLG